ncbi:hypothetical protein BHE74_00042870 [Ensete ventricosum]|nr:hypothetical protein BHE74_00042870 [Ensete ventricosum]
MGHREQRLVESRYHMDSIGGWGILLKSLLWLVETGEREEEDSGGDEWLLCGDVAVSATCLVLAVGSHYLRSLCSHTMTDAGVAWALIRMMERPTAGEKVGDKHPEK